MHIQILKKYHFIDNFDHNKLKNFTRDICLIWRSKHSQCDVKLISKTAQFCKKRRIKFFLSNDFKLAIKLNVDGVYLSAYNKEFRSNCYSLKKKFKIIGSAHDLKEIKTKKNQKVKEIFISPIFKNNKRKALGIYKSNYLLRSFRGKKIALGGINKKNMKLLKLVKFDGFAGIDYFN